MVEIIARHPITHERSVEFFPDVVDAWAAVEYYDIYGYDFLSALNLQKKRGVPITSRKDEHLLRLVMR